MPTNVALLRGINVGGRNRLAMADLVSLLEEAGARSVRTYIQSGNVVFDAATESAPSIVERVRQQLRTDFELDVPLVLRSAAELQAIADGNPFLRGGSDPKHLHVGFLLDTPDRSRAESLDPARSDTDSFELVGRDLYLHLPGGVARTKLTTPWLDRSLGTVVTVRNWRTVTRLVELSGGSAP